MDGTVLLNSGKIKALKNKKYKKSKIKAIILPCDSNMLGRLYRLLPAHTYTRLRSCKFCSLSYDFIDGSIIDDSDIDEFVVRNKHYFDSGEDLITKLDEIYVAENNGKITFNNW